MNRLDIVKELSSMRDYVLQEMRSYPYAQGNLLVRINKVMLMINEGTEDHEQSGQTKRTKG